MLGLNLDLFCRRFFLCLTSCYTKGYCRKIDKGIVTTGHYDYRNIVPIQFIRSNSIKLPEFAELRFLSEEEEVLGCFSRSSSSSSSSSYQPSIFSSISTTFGVRQVNMNQPNCLDFVRNGNEYNNEYKLKLIQICFMNLQRQLYLKQLGLPNSLNIRQD